MTDESWFCILCQRRYEPADLIAHHHGINGLTRKKRKQFLKKYGSKMEVKAE